MELRKGKGRGMVAKKQKKSSRVNMSITINFEEKLKNSNQLSELRCFWFKKFHLSIKIP